jgi:tetratricopeptide (TPR) repeat protein
VDDAILSAKAALSYPPVRADREKKAGDLLYQAYMQLGQVNYDQAIELAQQANESLPDEFKYLVYYIVGHSHLWLARTASFEGEKTYQQIVMAYRASDHSRSAFDHLLQAKNLKPDFSPALYGIFLHYSWVGDWPDALLASDALVKLMPRCAEALRSRAECYYNLNRPAAAKSDLQAAIDLAPQTGKLYFELAGVHVELRDYPAAIASYETALELKVAPVAVHASLGDTYRRAGDFDRAISEYERARAHGLPADWCDREIAKCRQRQR